MKRRSMAVLAMILVLVTVLAMFPASSMALTLSIGGQSGSSSDTGSSASSNSTSGLVGEVTKKCNFRVSADTSSDRVSGCRSIPKGAEVTVIDNTSDDDYMKVSYKGYTGWIYSDYVEVKKGTVSSSTGTNTNTNTNGGGLTLGSGSQSSSGSSSSGLAGEVTKKCNFRVEPNTSSDRVSGCGSIPKGAEVTVIDNTSNDDYMKVSYKGYTGWIYADYVEVKKTSSSTSTGTNTNNGGLLGGNISSNGSTGTAAGSTSGSSSGITNGNGMLSIGSQASTSGSSYTGGLQYASYTGGSADRWGSMRVAGTNINDTIYCNAIDKNGNFIYNDYSSSYNYVYALSYKGAPISVIYGHNMRVAARKGRGDEGLHELHHVQNAWLGGKKCELCGDSTSGAKTSVFDISYNGSSKWQLCGFFELNSSNSSSSVRKSVVWKSSMESYRSGAALQSWIDDMMGYCTSKYKGAKLADLNSNNKVMVIVTCGDKSGDGNQRLYMILKAVG